jgi:hypothetical protein
MIGPAEMKKKVKLVVVFGPFRPGPDYSEKPPCQTGQGHAATWCEKVPATF